MIGGVMPSDWPALFAVLGPIAISVTFVVMGLLSRRLGRVTRTRPYYAGFFLAALLVGLGLLARILDQAPVYTGLLALGVTTAAFVAWRYWSWLLSERS
jgi:hypothetical protein